MRLVSFQSIYEGVIRRFGQDPRKFNDLDAAENIAEKATQRIAQILEIWDWPELSRTEERAFRSVWNDGRNFKIIGEEGTPDEFYYLGNLSVTGNPGAGYYKVKANAPGDPPAGTLPTNTTYFETLDNPEPFIARDQTCRRTLGVVLGIYPTNPSSNGCCDHGLTFQPSERGVKVNGVYNCYPWYIAPNPPQPASPATVFVWYLIPAPQFTMKPYINGKTYGAGEVVFYAPPDGDGNCYKALTSTSGNVPTNIDFWVLQPVPSVLATYIKEGTYADALTDSINGEPPSDAALKAAGLAESKAQASLQREIDKLIAQGQVHFYGGMDKWRWTGVWNSQPWGGNKVELLTDVCETDGFMPERAVGSPWEFLREVVSLAGASPSLRGVNTTNRKSGDMVTIVIGPSGDRDKSTWQLLPGAADPTNDGQVAPLDYNSTTNNVHWEVVGD